MNRLTLITLILIIFNSYAFSCDCKEYDSIHNLLMLEIENSDLIITAEHISNKKGSYLIKVKEVFKGDFKVGQIIEGKLFDSCSKLINKNGEWLIYATIENENIININNCGLTRNKNFPFESNFYSSPPPNLNSNESNKFVTKRKIQAVKDYKREIKFLRNKFKP